MTGEALAQVADRGEKSIGMVTLILGPVVDFLSLLPSPALHHAANHIELPSLCPTLCMALRLLLQNGSPLELTAEYLPAAHELGIVTVIMMQKNQKGGLPLLWLRALTTDAKPQAIQREHVTSADILLGTLLY